MTRDGGEEGCRLCLQPTIRPARLLAPNFTINEKNLPLNFLMFLKKLPILMHSQYFYHDWKNIKIEKSIENDRKFQFLSW